MVLKPEGSCPAQWYNQWNAGRYKSHCFYSPTEYITQNIRDDYYDVTVQITTFEVAHNPPYGFDTITLRIQSFEVINYEHKDVSNIGKIPFNTLKTSTYLTTLHLINGESNLGLEVLISPSPFLIWQSGTQLLFHPEKLQSLFPLYTPSSFPLVLRINSYQNFQVVWPL